MLDIHKDGNQMCNLCGNKISKRLPRLNIIFYDRYSRANFINCKICGKCIKKTIDSYKEGQIKNIIDWENRIIEERPKIKNLTEEEKLNKLEFRENRERLSGKVCRYCNLEIPPDIPKIQLKVVSIVHFICGKCIFKSYSYLPEKLYVSEDMYNKKMMIYHLGGDKW